MERRPGSRGPDGPLIGYPPPRPSPARGEGGLKGEGDLSPEDELWIAFGRALGFTIAAIVLLVGGGIVVFLLAAAFFHFLYGG